MSVAEQLRQPLEDALAQMPLTVNTAQKHTMLQYLAMLHKWNKTFNLTAIRDPHEMLTLHLLDSLAIAPHFNHDNIIDVGTGAGLPGIPLAIMNPDKQFTLLDSNHKKTRFVVQAVGQLGLKNVNVVHHRLESYQPETPFSMVISRAFSQISDMIAWSHHLLAKDGEFWAMKGVFPDSELESLDDQYQMTACHALQVPNLAAERHLVIIRKTQ